MNTTDYEELPPIKCALVSHRAVYAVSFCCGAAFALFVMAVL
jgi:hypothetical protein